MKKVLSETPKIEIWQGDCVELLKQLKENRVDAVITDPPYGIGFMGKEWDNFKPKEIKKTTKLVYKTDYVTGTYDLSYKGMLGFQNWYCEVMKECLHVLKPGGYLLSFGGTRTYHRMAVAIEDAGFEVRDMINWVYGSGFPKSLNIGKAVDKLQGNEREYLGFDRSKYRRDNDNNKTYSKHCGQTGIITKGTSEWEGWGTALKPSHEPICLARKPLSEKSVAENVLKWKTGGLNIDESRVGYEKGDYEKLKNQEACYGEDRKINTKKTMFDGQSMLKSNTPAIFGEINKQGRFPANLIHDNSPEVRECFPESSGGAFPKKINGQSPIAFRGNEERENRIELNDSGSASRFFKSIIYTPKASKSERNMGCEGLEEKIGGAMMANTGETMGLGGASLKGEPKQKQLDRNNHPTVKPIALMEYLIKMITPKGGIVLDPFMGSGSTGIACGKNGFSFIGIEKEEEYVKIAEARIKTVLSQKKLF